MSERQALVQRLYDAHGRRDIDAALVALTDDVAWPDVAGGTVLRGHEACRAYWTNQFATVDPHVTPLAVAEHGDEIAVTVHQVVRSLDGKVLRDGDVVHVFTFRGDRIASMHIEEAKASAVLRLGEHRFDITTRAVVMGILNRTPDSFYDKGAYFSFDDFLRRADQLVADGADLLDVGGVKAGPGPEVTETEELERVVPAVEALRTRFDLPLSVDTWRASVARACFETGAIVGNDISGFADPDYLPVCAAAGASVVATHIRLRPRVPDPTPEYPEGVGTAVVDFLADRAAQAEAAGIPRDRIMVDAGLDLGKTEPQSLQLLRTSDQLAALGYPVFLSASNKRFLGDLCGTDVVDRRDATNAAHALGIALGCRVLRAHDVRGARRTAAVMAAILEARR